MSNLWFFSVREITLFTANVELLNYLLGSPTETVGCGEFWELNLMVGKKNDVL